MSKKKKENPLLHPYFWLLIVIFWLRVKDTSIHYLLLIPILKHNLEPIEIIPSPGRNVYEIFMVIKPSENISFYRITQVLLLPVTIAVTWIKTKSFSVKKEIYYDFTKCSFLTDVKLDINLNYFFLNVVNMVEFITTDKKMYTVWQQSIFIP